MIGMLVHKLSIMDYSKSVQTVRILPDTCVRCIQSGCT